MQAREPSTDGFITTWSLEFFFYYLKLITLQMQAVLHCIALKSEFQMQIPERGRAAWKFLGFASKRSQVQSLASPGGVGKYLSLKSWMAAVGWYKH